MLRSVQDLHGYAILATDGEIGHVKDVYFDDHNWALRYFVVETGSWLSSRKVLIPRFAVSAPDWVARVLPASITREQVKASPDIDTDKPVSRQHEMRYLEYYGLPYYWGSTGLWAGAAYPGAMLTGVAEKGSGADYLVAKANDAEAAEDAEERRKDHSDPYLRSCNTLLKYHVKATDGSLGHVKGMLVDVNTWAVRYLIVETSNWWGGHQVLIAPEWIEALNWLDATIAVKLTRLAVKAAPAYDPVLPLNRDQEVDLHGHHGLAGYWAAEVKLQDPEFPLTQAASHKEIQKYT